MEIVVNTTDCLSPSITVWVFGALLYFPEFQVFFSSSIIIIFFLSHQHVNRTFPLYSEGPLFGTDRF